MNLWGIISTHIILNDFTASDLDHMRIPTKAMIYIDIHIYIYAFAWKAEMQTDNLDRSTCGSMESVTVFSETRDGEGDVGLGKAVPRKGVPPELILLVPELDPTFPVWPTFRVSEEAVLLGERERWEPPPPPAWWGTSRLSRWGSLCKWPRWWEEVTGASPPPPPLCSSSLSSSDELGSIILI
jgi:hypothetical protein